MTTQRPIPILPLLAALIALLACAGAHAQGEHTTSAAAEFRPDVRQLQVILRLDPEQFEGALGEFTRQPMTLLHPDAERAAAMLLRSRLQMMDADGVLHEFEWIGMQVEPTWAYVMVQFPIPRRTEGLQITNRLYLSRHEDQQNVMNVKVGAEETVLTFTRETPWKPIALPAAPDSGLTPIPRIDTRGHGPVQMVLIPTHNSGAPMFEPFMERNAERYTMHALTLPGMAGTAHPPEPLPADASPWIDNAVAATAQAIADLRLEDPVILGSGLGGVIAYRLAIEHPDAVGPIVTLDALPAMLLSRDAIGPSARRAMVDKVNKPMFDKATDEQWQGQFRLLAGSIVVEEDRRAELLDMFLQTPPHVSKQYLLEHMRLDLTDKLAEIRSPVLAIAAVNHLGAARGVDAADIRQAWESAFAPAIRQAPDRFTLVFFDDTGQFVTEERPEKLDETVAEFLGELE